MGTTKDDFDWDLGAELAGDRAVASAGARLRGRKVVLMICGGIAAYRAPDIVRALRKEGAEVSCFATAAALAFVTADVLEWTSTRPPILRLDGRAQHIELGTVDAFLVAPATYSTIGKMANGIADNAVTTVLASALGSLGTGGSAILIAPAMHGSMVHTILRRNLRTLTDMGCRVIPPRGEDGKAKLPEVEVLVEALCTALRTPATPRDA